MLTKLDTKHHWVKGIQVYPHTSPRSDNSEVLKLYKQHLQYSSREPMGLLIRLNEGGQRFFFRRDHWYPK